MAGSSTAPKARGSRKTRPRSRSSGFARTGFEAQGFFAPLGEADSRAATWPLIALLVTALVAGGGGSPAPLAELVVQLAAIAALAWAALVRRSDLSVQSAFRRDWPLVTLGLLLAASMAAQLVPLPPALWGALPGREALVENAKAFAEMPWLPFSMAPQLTLAALLSVVPPFTAYLLASGTRQNERDWLLPVLALFAAATLLLQLVQLGGAGFLYGAQDESYVRGFQANRNAQGDILAILLAALASRPFAGGARGAFTILQLTGSAVLVLAAVLTGSRAGIALCLALAALILAREGWARRKAAGRMLAATIAAGAAVLVALAALLAGNANILRAAARFDTVENYRAELIWPDAWYAAQQFMPWGVGFGTFVPAFRIFESQEVVDNTAPNRAHNELLELLIEGGVPALALALAALALVCWRGWQVMRGGLTPAARGRGAMLVLVSAALATHSLVDYPIRAMSIAVLWALLLGLVTADRAEAKARPPAPAGEDGERSRVESSRTLKSSFRRAPRGEQTGGQRARMIAALAALAALVIPATVISALDRARRPQPFDLSCALPTPQSCLGVITARLAREPEADLTALTERLARRYPGDATIQALHGTRLLAAGSDAGTLFLFNSARLGWREPLGQVHAFDSALAEGDVPRAVLHLDALLRSRPQMIDQPGLIDRVLATPAVRQEWAARLGANPLYFADLVNYFAASAAGEAAPQDAAWANRVELLALARGNGATLSAEVRDKAVWAAFAADRARAADLFGALAGQGGWQKGLAAWSIAPATGNLPEPGLPFAWSSFPGRQGTLVVERPANGPARFVTARALSGPATRLARVTVFLGSGIHELRWRVTGAEPSTLFPSITCPGGGVSGFDLLDPPSTDMGTAAITIDDECSGATLTIGKGQGRVPRGTAISDLELNRKRLLD